MTNQEIDGKSQGVMRKTVLDEVAACQREALVERYDRLIQIHRENGQTDYDAGRVKGFAEAMEIVNQCLEQ